MFKASRKMMLVFATSLAVAGLASVPAQAAVLHVNGERTAISLSTGFLKFLSFNTTAVLTTGNASVGSDGYGLPVTGGWVNTESTNGRISHSGGVVFGHGGLGPGAGRLLSFRDFVLVRNGNRTFLKALLSTATLAGLVPDLIDRGWVVFARVDAFAVSIRRSP